MADYWKSLEKKFCDTCKCWLADNKASIEFHENGKRHKENVQKRLKEIQKKNKQDDRKERKLEYDMKRIEEAAKAAMKKDMEDNPDMTMKLQAYYEKTGLSSDPDSKEESSTSGGATGQPKIAHRSEKEKKADEAKLAQMNKPSAPYNRYGGWQTLQNKESLDLELPSTTPSHQFVAKQPEKRKPIKFEEKSVSSITSSSTSALSSSGFLPVKTEPTVTFKKRRVDRGNMRQRDDD